MRSCARRAAERAAAVAGLVTAVAVLMAGFALIGVAAAGAGGAVAGIAAAAALTAVVRGCADRLVLSAMLARPVSEVEQPELYRLVRELSTAGRLPVPRLALSPAEQPNSFTVGRGPRTATVCCTQGLLRTLAEAELRGVLGHELAHVAGRDLTAGTMSAGLAAVVMFPAEAARFARPGGPAVRGRVDPGGRVDSSGRAGRVDPVGRVDPGGRFGSVARVGRSGRGMLAAALLLLFGPLAAVLVRLAVSPEREYRADAAGALLTGDPVALSSALRRLDAQAAELALVPDGRRLAVGHLMIVSPFRAEGIARLFGTHPPAAERVRRLEALAGYRR